MGNHGIRISTPGNDALTQDEKRIVYSSKFSTPKIYKKGYVRITTNGSGIGTAKVPHGLGYAPTFYVFRKATASYSFLDGSSYTQAFHPCPGTATPWIPYHQTSDAYTDATNLTIYIQGANSTSYDFVYFIFIDQAEANQKAGLDTLANYGMKISKEGNDPTTSSEQKTAFNSQDGTLKYYQGQISDYGSLTLPALAGDYFDTEPEEGTYVDFLHPLGYPPFFLAFMEDPSNNERYSVPDIYLGNLYGNANYALTAWCDKSRIRITLWKKAHYNTASPGVSENSWSADSINLKVYIFTEDLNLQL
jgi:hypothetical protein